MTRRRSKPRRASSWNSSAVASNIEDALWALKRATGEAMIAAIGGARQALGVSLVEARELIETSPAFNADHAIRWSFRAQLLARLRPAIEAARRRAVGEG
jgi:hypothetical protein